MSDNFDVPHTQPTSSESGTFSRERRTPLRVMEDLLHTFSPAERLLMYIFAFILAASTFFLLVQVNQGVSQVVPTKGGAFTEGTIGTPRFINPLLAISPVDQDLTALIYSGLMRANADGVLVPDLAESYSVNDEGTIYTFTLRPDATFHDGTPVTAEDVVFTVTLAQNPDIKSPRRADWDGVSVQAEGDRTVTFTLPQAYAPFLENAQLGILPKKLWEGVSASEFPFFALNTSPIGTGPFLLEKATNDATGLPRMYELAPFENFALGTPHLGSITFRFYGTQEQLLAAYAEEEIDSMSGLAGSEVPEGADAIGIESTRIFGIFFNQNKAPIFTDKAVRQALSQSIDRNAVIESVLSGYGTPLTNPLPPGLLPIEEEPMSTSTTPLAQARETLEDGGWKFDDGSLSWSKGGQKLTINLATADTPELHATAEAVAEEWRSLGAEVNVQVYPLSEFSAQVLRPRNYDAVLFGEVIGRTLDLFAFWHSSQRNDPGLNLALYTNTNADRLLASARAEISARERETLYREFVEIITEDAPAIFLYAPKFVYVYPSAVAGLTFPTLTTPAERFLQAHAWYTDTESVWSIFTHY